MKDVEKNDSCKACDYKLSSVRDKKKEIIKKYEIRPVSEWITITKNSIHSMTSKTIVAKDSSLVNQDVISVKDVAGIEDLEFLTDKDAVTDCNELDVNVEEAVAGMKELEFNNDNDKNSSTVVLDIDAPVVKEKKVEEKLNTISAAVTDSDLIDEKNNFLADD